jgi:uncharacterized protein (DUF58 family)
VAQFDLASGVTMQVADLLPVERMVQLERLSRRSPRRIVGSLAGRHQSVRRGSSLDFADHRRYFAGDDVRHIDYHALARFDQLMVRQFDAEEQNTVRIVLDTSASMSMGEKFRHVQEIAAALAFIALNGGDSVCVHTTGSTMVRRFSGGSALTSFVDYVAGLAVSGPTPLASALADVASRLGPPGTTAVLSDLFSDEWQRGLRSLVHPRRTTLVLHALHPDECLPTVRGDLELVDVETGERRQVSVDAESSRAYEIAATAWQHEIRTQTQALGFRHRRTLVADDIVAIVTGILDETSLPLAQGTKRT